MNNLLKNTQFEHNKYKHIKQPTRIYPSKYFGNDFGHSLEKQVEQGYTTDLESLMPIFNRTNTSIKPYMKQEREDFSQPDSLRSVDKYLSKHARTWPHKYYKNDFGHSLQHIVNDRIKYKIKKEDFKILDKKNRRSGPYQWNRNDFGHSLQSITDIGGTGVGLAFSN